MKKVPTAVIQMNAGPAKEVNLENASRLIRRASRKGARLVALPELFNWRGCKKEIEKNSEPLSAGYTFRKMADLASSLKIYLLCGSILEINPRSKRPFNTSIFLSPQGKLIAKYRKIHLFKLHVSGKNIIDEQSLYSPGKVVRTASTPLGTIGFTICYDLRFPELYRALTYQGAEIIFVPSAFTLETGNVHWATLIRARAIENQVFIIAPNQCGKGPSTTPNYGHSMIVDPWGTVITSCKNEEKIIYAELDLLYLKKVRRKLPALTHSIIKSIY
jgi:predicted amidohydrolase